MNTTAPAPASRPEDFQSLIDLLNVLGEANRMHRELEAKIERGYLALVADERTAYANIQQKVGEAEAAIEVIVRRNPQWFPEDRKTVVTPFGSVKSVSSKEIVVANEEASIVLVRNAKRTELLRETVVLNKEALQELSEAELASFGIVRKAKENITVKTDVIDLGKSVKAVDKSEKAANKAAKSAAALSQKGAA